MLFERVIDLKGLFLYLLFFNLLTALFVFPAGPNQIQSLVMFFLFSILGIIAIVVKPRPMVEPANIRALTSVEFASLAIFSSSPLISFMLANPSYIGLSLMLKYLFASIGLSLIVLGLPTKLFVRNDFRVYATLATSIIIYNHLNNINLSLEKVGNLSLSIFLRIILDFSVLTLFFLVIFYFRQKYKSKLILLIASIFTVAFSSLSSYAHWEQIQREASKEEARFKSVLDADLIANSYIKLEKRPNIYFLIYDSFPNPLYAQEAGIDISQLTDFLLQNDFNISNNVYSTGAATLESIGRLLHPTGDGSLGVRDITSGNSPYVNVLKRNDYKTSFLAQTDYLFNKERIAWDYHFPNSKVSTPLHRSILRGSLKVVDSAWQYSDEEYSEAKKYFFKSSLGSPHFYYLHSSTPGHTENYGYCIEQDLIDVRHRIKESQRSIRTDVLSVLNSDPQAVIFILSDHGPYLTKNCTYMGNNYDPAEITREDILDRFGVFFASNASNLGLDITPTVLQHLFPTLLNTLSSTDSYKFDVDSLRTATDQGPAGSVFVEKSRIVGGMDDKEPLFP